MRRNAIGNLLNACLMLSAIVLLPGTGNASVYTADACIGCHAQEGGESRLRIVIETYQASVHAAVADCTHCHAGITDDDHMRITGLGRVDCGQCHYQVNEHGLSGIDMMRPDCADCHTRHAIRSPSDPAASVHLGNLMGTCGRCHPAQSGQTGLSVRIASARVAFHGKGDLANDYTMRNCIGCHLGQAAHGEKALPEAVTCHICHMDDNGQSALWGNMHPPQRLTERPALLILALIYQVIGILMLAAGVTLVVRRWRRPHDKDEQT